MYIMFVLVFCTLFLAQVVPPTVFDSSTRNATQAAPHRPPAAIDRSDTGSPSASDTLPSRYQPVRATAPRAKSVQRVAVSPAFAADIAGHTSSVALQCKKAGTRRVVSRVAVRSTQARPVATISRATYEDAGVEVSPTAGVSSDRLTQNRSGGRDGKGGFPSDTRRDTWRTIGKGMLRASSAAVLGLGFEPCMRRLFDPLPSAAFQDLLCADLRQRAVEIFRGEVWPLNHAFGVLSRYVSGVYDEKGRSVSSSVVTTWLNDAGVMCCSCIGRSSHVGRVRSSPRSDAPCTHARIIAAAVGRLCRRMGVPPPVFRRQVPQIYAGEGVDLGGATSDAGEGADPGGAFSAEGRTREYWDAERTLETFRAGQSIVAVEVTGMGPYKVVAQVLCSRNCTACAFYNTAAGLSCVHALRCRSVRPEMTADGPAKKSRADDEDAARSTMQIPVFNWPRSVQINVEMCELIQQGKVLEVPAPAICPTCSTAVSKYAVRVDAGKVVCSMGFCNMKIGSFYCSTKGCCVRIYPDGRAAGIIILSSSSATTLIIMRDMAREVTTCWSIVGACYRRWHNRYANLRDSGAYPAMKNVKPKTRQTITRLFFLSLRLVCGLSVALSAKRKTAASASSRRTASGWAS